MDSSLVDRATTDLRKLLEGFKGDGARQARLASIGHRIENRCREVIELKVDFIRRMGDLSRRRETPSAELTALVEDFSVRRVKYREELLGVQDELRQALTKAEWDQARTKVYRELIEVRQAFIDTLSPEEWDKVFG